MTSREKNAVFARMEASCQAQQLKQQLFKEAMEYKAYLIAMGFVVGNFDFKHQEAIFYQYMMALECSCKNYRKLLEEALKEVEVKEKEVQEAEQKAEDAKKHYDDVVAVLEALKNKDQETQAALDRIKDKLHAVAVSEAEESEKRKKSYEASRKKAKSLQEQIEAETAKLQKLLEQAKAAEAEEQTKAAEAEEQAKTAAEEQTKAAEAEEQAKTAAEEQASETGRETVPGRNNGETMPVEAAAPMISDKEKSGAEQANSLGADAKYSEIFDEIERAKNVTSGVQGQTSIHNPEDVEHIKELEEKDKANTEEIKRLANDNADLRQQVAELKEKREADEELQEELKGDFNYKTKKNSSNSSLAPRSNMPNCEQATPPILGGTNEEEGSGSGTEKGNPSAEEKDDEAQAAYNALHDPRKSPDAGTGSEPKKPGKPKGSHGGGMGLNEKAIQRPIQYCDPVECHNCPHREQCQKERLKKAETRHVEDIEIRLVRDTYVSRKCYCPVHQKEIQGEFPPGLAGKGSKQYGANIRALSILMNTYGFVSYERTAQIINSFCGTTVSHGSIYNWVHEAADMLGDVMSYIGEALLSEKVAYLDETGVAVNGILFWLHTFCDANYTYLHADPKRGRDGMDRGGLLPFFTGTIVTDCWASYFTMKNVRHGLCNAHLLRELYALVCFYPKDQAWAQDLMNLMREMDHKRNLKKDAKQTSFTSKELKEFWDKYDEIVNRGLDIHNLSHEPVDRTQRKKAGKKHQQENDDQSKDGRKPLGKAVNLLLRLRDYKEMYLLFTKDFDVEFSNGNAERSFRMVSKKRSIVGAFTKPQGASDWATIWSYLDTCRKHGISQTDALIACLSGQAVNLLFSEEDQAALRKARKARLNDPNNKDKLDALEELNKEADEIFNNWEKYKEEKEKEREERKRKKAETKQKPAKSSATTAANSESKAS